MEYVKSYLENIAEVAKTVDAEAINNLVEALVALRAGGGRLFLLGVGGSAGNAGHAVNDFRKLADIETYAPTDNVSELTARTNDEGWDTVFSAWLRTNRIGPKDAIMIFSVGGGDRERNVSANLVAAIDMAKEAGAKVFGIVGRDGGYTKRNGDIVVLIPTVHEERITPISESYQAVVWHLLVSDPRLMAVGNKWESMQK